STSKGVHVVGRRASPLTPDERELAVRLCRSLGGVGHEVVAAPRDATRPAALRVAVELHDGRARAEVAVRVAGRVRRGVGEADRSTVAVAQAVLAAVDPELRLTHLREDDLGGDRVVLTLVDSGPHRAPGSALSGDEPLRAVAEAALDAAG